MTIPRNTPAPAAATPVLQWANGKPVGRPAGTGERFRPIAGFHIEAGRDAALDAALDAAEWPQMEIKHQRPGGAEVVRHWWLGEDIEFLPVTAGPPADTVTGCLTGGYARLTAEAGLGLRWPQGERSQLAVRGYVRGLYEVGYGGLVQLAVRSRMTDELLSALVSHVRVAEAADAMANRTVSLADLWLPLTAGEETEFGRGDTATVIPFVARHPDAPMVEYLRSLWRPATLAEAALSAWPQVQAWAAEFAAGGELPPAPAVDPETGEVYEPLASRRSYGRH